MQVYIETTPCMSERSRIFWITAAQVFLGSLFFAACAQISIPLQPVPLSLQTLAVFLLAIMQGGKKASLSVLLYLVECSMGLPFLAGGAINPLWILGTNAGYLLAFPVAAYVVGKLVEMKENPSALWVMISIFCGQLIIYSLGVAFLSRFIGLKMSFYLGVLPFLPLAGLKLIVASSLSGLWVRWKHRLM